MLSKIRGRLDYLNWRPRSYWCNSRKKPYNFYHDGTIYFYPRLDLLNPVYLKDNKWFRMRKYIKTTFRSRLKG